MRVDRLTDDDWPELQDVRLRALRDSPQVFGSSLEREVGFKESHWRMRLRGSSWFVARADDGSHAGLVCVIAEPGAPAHERHLVALWVAPESRGAGVAAGLVAAAEEQALSEGASVVTAWVLDDNVAAHRCLARVGYAPSGVRMPLPRDRSRTEERWTRRLDGEGAGQSGPQDLSANPPAQ